VAYFCFATQFGVSPWCIFKLRHKTEDIRNGVALSAITPETATFSGWYYVDLLSDISVEPDGFAPFSHFPRN
jgi:hypothetical protein